MSRLGSGSSRVRGPGTSGAALSALLPLSHHSEISDPVSQGPAPTPEDSMLSRKAGDRFPLGEPTRPRVI
jgi:hypothetical protein